MCLHARYVCSCFLSNPYEFSDQLEYRLNTVRLPVTSKFAYGQIDFQITFMDGPGKILENIRNIETFSHFHQL